MQKEREILDTLHEESAKIEEALEIEKEERLANFTKEHRENEAKLDKYKSENEDA